MKGDKLVMKKRLICFLMCLLVAIIMVGCTEKSYELHQSVDKIVSIEIIVAESRTEYTVKKELSHSEIISFLGEFDRIKFKTYYGSPTSIFGNAVKITYKDGNYELICARTIEYIEDGYVGHYVNYCDETEFDAFLSKYVPEGALRKYYTRNDFQNIIIGQHTYQDVYKIAPAELIQTTSSGGECKYYLKNGGYILITFYGNDLIVESIEELYPAVDTKNEATIS